MQQQRLQTNHTLSAPNVWLPLRAYYYITSAETPPPTNKQTKKKTVL